MLPSPGREAVAPRNPDSPGADTADEMVDVAISIAHSQEEFFRLIRLREEVFVLEQHVPLQLELDGEDDRATHLVAKAGSEIVGTARLVFRGTEGKIGRMAVQQPWRHRGIGKKLLDHLIALADERGVGTLLLHAQEQAVPFYLRQGFRVEGDRFKEAGISHFRMRRESSVSGGASSSSESA